MKLQWNLTTLEKAVRHAQLQKRAGIKRSLWELVRAYYNTHAGKNRTARQCARIYHKIKSQLFWPNSPFKKGAAASCWPGDKIRFKPQQQELSFPLLEETAKIPPGVSLDSKIGELEVRIESLETWKNQIDAWHNHLFKDFKDNEE